MPFLEFLKPTHYRGKTTDGKDAFAKAEKGDVSRVEWSEADAENLTKSGNARITTRPEDLPTEPTEPTAAEEATEGDEDDADASGEGPDDAGEADTYPCPEEDCGREFARPAGLGAHRKATGH